MEQLILTNPTHRVFVECVGFRLRAAIASFPGELYIDEPARFLLEQALEQQKLEDGHNFAIAVTLLQRDDRPIISVSISGIEVYTFG